MNWAYVNVHNGAVELRVYSGKTVTSRLLFNETYAANAAAAFRARLKELDVEEFWKSSSLDFPEEYGMTRKQLARFGL